VVAVRAAQVNFFQARRAATANREAILAQRIDQLDRQIAGLQRQLASNRRQLELIQEETTDVDSSIAGDSRVRRACWLCGARMPLCSAKRTSSRQ
jgi:hypothetical protein